MASQNVVTYSGRSQIWRAVNAAATAAPKYIAWGDSTATASNTGDVNLFKPQTEARTTGTLSFLTTTQLADTMQVVGSITCTNATKTITEAGLFDTNTPVSPTTTIATSSMAIGATTVTLAAASGIASGNYFRQIDNEVVLVTGGQNTTTETVTRAQLGTASAAHAIGVATTVGGDGGANNIGATGGQTVTYALMYSSYGGNMFCHADFSGIALSVNDSINFTFKDQLT